MDPTPRDNPDTGNPASRTDIRDTLRLVVALLATLILCVGIVLWGALFIWLCFKYPDSADSFIKALVPAGVLALSSIYGRDAVKKLLDKKTDTK